MSLAIVCEWIEPTGGAEKVLDAMVEAYPHATLHTLWDDAPGRYPRTAIIESWMARTPLRRHKAFAMPLMSPTWRRLRSDEEVDRVLVSSYAFAHHARFVSHPDVPRFAYVHSPARYLWAPEIDPRGRRALVRQMAPLLKALDRRRAAEVDSMAANSRYIQDRIAKAWGIDAKVIYPPVDTEMITARPSWRDALTMQEDAAFERLPADFVLGASRLVEYKRLDAVLDFAKAVALPVVIAGDGPDRARLEDYASSNGINAVFLGHVTTEFLYALYQKATAFVFPPAEDFGIMPVEAMAAGARVIVGTQGGVVESVEHGVSGVHTAGFTGADARAALDAVSRLDPRQVQLRSRLFSRARFMGELRTWVDGGVASVVLP